MFCAISATAVREMTVSVTFGAPRVGLLVAPCRRPMFGHPLDMGSGEVRWEMRLRIRRKAVARDACCRRAAVPLPHLGRHSSTTVIPSAALAVPGGHLLQDSEPTSPVAEEKVAAGHGVQVLEDGAPSRALQVPSGQGTHLVFSSLSYVPAGHCAHSASPVAETLPSVSYTHLTLPTKA